jgi:integrase
MTRKKKPIRKSTAQHSYHNILDGAAKLFLKENSGDVYQFQMWIAEEKRHLRRTLRTTDLTTALKRGTDLYLETYSDVKTGRKIFGITLKELVDAYLEYRQEDVENGNIKASRLTTMRCQLKHLVSYKGGSTKVSSLDRDSCYEYANWKLKTYPTTKKITIRNEQSTFNAVMVFGFRKGLTHFDTLDFRKLVLKEADLSRRNTFTLKEYRRLLDTLKSYTSVKECPDETERLERMLVQDAILLASNTLCRVGELFALRWKDIESIVKKLDETGQEVSVATIFVRGETSKTGRSRRFVCRGGQYLERLRKRTSFTDPEDFVFSAVGSGLPPKKSFWYSHWKTIMGFMGIPDYKEKKITFYSLRHFGITCRIRAKVEIFELAEAAGTSQMHITNTYGHWDESMLQDVALKNFTLSVDGITYKD